MVIKIPVQLLSYCSCMNPCILGVLLLSCAGRGLQCLKMWNWFHLSTNGYALCGKEIPSRILKLRSCSVEASGSTGTLWSAIIKINLMHKCSSQLYPFYQIGKGHKLVLSIFHIRVCKLFRVLAVKQPPEGWLKCNVNTTPSCVYFEISGVNL